MEKTMNAKEVVLNILKNRKNIAIEFVSDSDIIMYNNLITAVENAIFDVPSEEEIEERANSLMHEYYQGGFHDGCDYILNYKKPEIDEKK